ncbi:ArsR/SmtB family transcription factor [Halopenitus persicus]|uniref:Helix-turn-helix domain-containing protein n=1 Tax=Halopenitus persicus TaxID=1048396 RepID=A0A1H3P0E8_9EURY|nr:helix-turn-helix domain-containing protein [Halopenitus persicus]SDY94433.1 Helix-turn-helix domain-containing protein [Halopenitus persicus]
MKVNDLITAEFTAGDECSPGVVTLDDSDVIESLSSATAQRIVSTLTGSPRTASAIADEVDTSIQTVSYHLDRLERAGIIASIGTAYSEKGRKMNIYALTTRKLVLSFRDGQQS